MADVDAGDRVDTRMNDADETLAFDADQDIDVLVKQMQERRQEYAERRKFDMDRFTTLAVKSELENIAPALPTEENASDRLRAWKKRSNEVVKLNHGIFLSKPLLCCISVNHYFRKGTRNRQ